MSSYVGADCLLGGLTGTYEFGVDFTPETNTIPEGTDMMDSRLYSVVKIPC